MCPLSKLTLLITAVSQTGERGMGHSPALVWAIHFLLREPEPFNGRCQRLIPSVQGQWDVLAHTQMSHFLGWLGARLSVCCCVALPCSIELTLPYSLADPCKAVCGELLALKLLAKCSQVFRNGSRSPR